LPLLYLLGLSTNDFGPALERFLGSVCGPVGSGHHPAHRALQGEAASFNRVVLADTDDVYV
jgi:hypothetical protein